MQPVTITLSTPAQRTVTRIALMAEKERLLSEVNAIDELLKGLNGDSIARGLAMNAVFGKTASGVPANLRFPVGEFQAPPQPAKRSNADMVREAFGKPGIVLSAIEVAKRTRLSAKATWSVLQHLRSVGEVKRHLVRGIYRSTDKLQKV